MKKYNLPVFSFLILLTGLMLLVSCRPKPLKIDVKSAEERLVVFTHLVPDKVMIVTLTKSFSVLDGFSENDVAKLLVSGATVQIKFNNETFAFQEINPGIYASFNEAYEYNQEYELIITAEGKTVTAKTVMLPKVNFANCVPVVEKLPADTNVFVDFAFNDVAGKSNWYMINFYVKNNSLDNDTLDGVNYFENGQNGFLKTVLVSDKEFGSTYSSRVSLESAGPHDSIVATLSNINEKYFDYLKLRSTGGNILNQLNMEPIAHPSNVQNGYGFFNAHFPDIRYFDLNQY